MCPISYAKDEQKVLFVISYLAGTPRGWARSILENPDHPYRRDFASFKEDLDAMYADRNLKQKALDRVGHLEQTKSVAAYSAEFQQTIAPLDLDNSSKHSMFYKGLNSDIKKALIYFPPAKTFEELLKQCVSIDQRRYASCQEEKFSEKSSKAHSKSPSSNNYKKPGQSPSSNSSSGSTQKHNKLNQSSGPHEPLSTDEKNRRRVNNLCFRCGSSQHRVGNCPLNNGPVPNRPAKASNAQTSNAKAPDYSGPSFPPENWLSQSTLRPVS
jgi:Retrotransposon gag protein